MLKILCFSNEPKSRNPFKAESLQMGVSNDGKFTLSALPKIGNNVIFGGKAPKDGKYTLSPDDTVVYITDGIITAISDGRQM